MTPRIEDTTLPHHVTLIVEDINHLDSQLGYINISNEVFDILLRLQQGEDWASALEHSIPKRKIKE